MSDPSFTAAALELSATIEDLRQSLPKPPPTSVTRAHFDSLDHAARHRLIRGGCAVTDPPAQRHPDHALREAYRAVAMARAGKTGDAAAVVGSDRSVAYEAMKFNADVARTFVGKFAADWDNGIPK